MKSSKVAMIAALIYLGIFLATWIFHYFITLQPSSGATIDIFPVLLTMPWGTFTVFFADSLGYIAWYGSFSASNHLLYTFFAMLGLLPAALINAGILFSGVKLISAKKKS